MAGNGMPFKEIVRSHGADPPKNESGRAGALICVEISRRYVNAENEFFIFISRILFKNEFGISSMSIVRTRVCRLSAAMMLFASCGIP